MFETRLQTGAVLLLALSLSAAGGVANATIISGGVTNGTGTFIKLFPPFTESDPDNTVGNDTFQDTNLYGFDEGQNIEITVDLNADDLADGMGGGSGVGIIPMGTVVASHYVFFDPAGAASQEGFVEFDSDILGLLTSTANLAASDFLINTGVSYLNPSERGLERRDNVAITGPRRLEVDWSASTPGDYVRVLTEFSPGAVDGTVPEPGILALLGTGLLGFARRRKSR